MKVYNLTCGQNVQHSLHSVYMARDVDDTIRRNLQRIMTDLNLNQTQFGIKVGVDSKYINKIIKEKRAMGKPVLERIAKALKIGVEELLREESIKQPPSNDALEEIKSLIIEADKTGEGAVIREKAVEYISLLVRDTKKKEDIGSEGKESRVPRRTGKQAE